MDKKTEDEEIDEDMPEDKTYNVNNDEKEDSDEKKNNGKRWSPTFSRQHILTHIVLDNDLSGLSDPSSNRNFRGPGIGFGQGHLQSPEGQR